MKIEILLSAINLNEFYLDERNIKSKCIVINQCEENSFSKYRDFDIYSYNEKGISNSRNRGLEKMSGDIILLADDSIAYNSDYENLILDEFKKRPKADIIIFNVAKSNKRINRNKRLHLYNQVNYDAYQIAFRRKSIETKKIVFSNLFGNENLYDNGQDTLFIVDSIKNKLKVYLSCKYIGTTISSNIVYDEKYLYDMGALSTAISIRFRKIVMLKYLIKNKKYLKDIKFKKAYKLMKKGSDSYLDKIYER